jgi:hypothetical protein
MASLKECLATLGLTLSDIENCSSAGGDCKRLVKRTFIKKTLTLHPDKNCGSDPSGVEFQKVHAAYERLVGEKGLLVSGNVVKKVGTSNQKDPGTTHAVALVTTIGLQCSGCSAPIRLMSLRVGSMDERSGLFQQWKGLDCRCFKVSPRLQKTLASLAAGVRGLDFDDDLITLLVDELSLSTEPSASDLVGLDTLNAHEKARFGRYVFDRANWKRLPIGCDL